MSENLIPIAEVDRLASARNLPLGNDRRGRWTDVGLIPPSQPIPFSPQRGYTQQEVDRILLVAEIAANIDSERPTAAEIAFLLAYAGHESPAQLVVEFLKDAVLCFQHRALRLINNHGQRCTEDDGLPEIVAKVLSSHILKCVEKKFADSFLFRELLHAMLGTILRAVLNGSETGRTYEFFEFGMRSIFRNISPDLTKKIWSDIHDLFQFLRLNQENAMLKALDLEIDDASVLRAARDAHAFLKLAGSVIPYFAGATIELKGAMFTEDDNAFFNRYFPAIGTAMLLAMRDDDGVEARLADLRAGTRGELDQGLEVMMAIGAELSSRL